MKKIIVGSDKSGFALKEAVKAHLEAQGYQVDDCGTQSVDNAKAYFEVAPVLAKKIAAKEYDRGILICGTGMGMAILANKVEGVYAAVCENTYAAEKARAINDANVLTMGGWLTADWVGCDIVDKFLNTEFLQGLDEQRQKFVGGGRPKFYEAEHEIYHG